MLSPVLRTDCEPLAGKSTLNCLEHTPRRHASKYHKIDCDDAQVDGLLVDLFLEAHERAPARDRAGSRQHRHPAARGLGKLIDQRCLQAAIARQAEHGSIWYATAVRCGQPRW